MSLVGVEEERWQGSYKKAQKTRENVNGRAVTLEISPFNGAPAELSSGRGRDWPVATTKV